MASATQNPAEQAQTRLSFAKVAASALKPAVPKEAAPKAKPPVATPRNLPLPQHPRSAPNKTQPPVVAADKVEKNVVEDKAGSKAIRTGEWTDSAVQSIAPASDIKEEVGERPRSIAFVKISAAEDSSTQLSSSDGSAKPPSIDGKSIASATTFALDEKESLRPDDSASLRAVEEEDVASPPESIIADSRQGSDHGAARAFRDQLHEIAVMNPQPHRGVPPGRFPTLPNGPHTLYDPNQVPLVARSNVQPVSNGMVPMNGNPEMTVVPDEKLLEALQSPRDRLFIVKLEQDFIDFIKETRESEYALPNCNTFYRMLAHRLADYYMLGHMVDSTMTGVKITRTPYCRIPPPVSQMVDPAKGACTPPVELAARKIMRRDDGKSGTNTTANSQNPSKTTSEVGGSAGSNDGDDDGKEKDLKNMTREQREARYREARQRIFGKAEAEEAENNDVPASGEEKDKEKDASRSSSANEKKKNKKQRNYDDDDFQARSHFNAYYTGQYAMQGYNGDNVVYYSGYPGPGQNPQFVMNPGASPQAMYSTPYPTMMGPEAQGQYNWLNQQYPATNTNPMMYGNYNSAQNGYDLSADFQRGMSSFQNTPMPSQVTPKMGNVPMAGYQDPYQQPQQMGMNPGWVQMSPQQQFGTGQNSYGPNGPGSRPMSAPQNAAPSAYPYGQFPTNPYNGKPNHNQHPIPGSYNRQQFNPQSQAFVPGGRMMPQMQPNMPQGVPQMSGYWINGMNTPPNGMPPQMVRMASSTTSSPPFGSPQSLPGPQGNSVGYMPRSTSQPGEPGQSSIAKYGTPSHLPAKPPAPVPAQQTPPKLPSVARPPNSMVVGST